MLQMPTGPAVQPLLTTLKFGEYSGRLISANKDRSLFEFTLPNNRSIMVHVQRPDPTIDSSPYAYQIYGGNCLRFEVKRGLDSAHHAKILFQAPHVDVEKLVLTLISRGVGFGRLEPRPADKFGPAIHSGDNQVLDVSDLVLMVRERAF